MNKAEHNEMWAKAARKWRQRDRELAGWGGATTWSSYVHGEALERAKELEAGRRKGAA